MFERTLEIDLAADEASLIEQLSELELLKSAAAARQARLTAALDENRRCAEAHRGIPAAKRGRGLASEIALARRDSPNRGGRHLGFARALVHEMPHTLAALETGALSEWRATLIVRESACLEIEDRRALDAEMCADSSKLNGRGDKRIEADAKAIAYRLDPHAVVDRAVRAESERTVTSRPAPDNMAYVTAFLPMAQGVAVYAALRRAGDACGDGRGRGQVMADTLVERVTGRPADVPVPVTVNLVVTDETLLGGDTAPGQVPGYGPIPAAIACRLASDAIADERSKATLRRLYRHPSSGALVAMESRARRFPDALARFIALRDNTCRTPYCDAPIRHTDHANAHAAGGATSELNGLGACEACNYAKEAPGWRVTTLRRRDGAHISEVTTPTGARHQSQAPPLLHFDRSTPSPVEAQLAHVLAEFAAA
ncbi:13E12 repeat family protein [Mycobacterium deserti]|uniref:13E12 repeat family protein n=1 Tax=Mycobacterium deserti TaxID=2978347 RepID=A0ABT2M7I1_9MYCO|nr:13E12 repeat family protein [Mycobacterium deserti]MCT7656956.1 13E12 repeat family protein [Mycobacterium deserti]